MNAPNLNRIYYSKISWGLLIFILAAFAAPLLLLLVQGQWVGLAIVFVSGLLPLSVYRNTRYEIRDNQLLITCGFLYQERIDINRIRSIQNSHNLISSPAPSLDRQEIKYNRYDEVLISLKDEDKKEFYAALKQLNPQIKIIL